MPYENIENVKKEQLTKILPLLQWKLEKNQLIINENQIAQYANLSLLEAAEFLNYLEELHVVCLKYEANCPECRASCFIEYMDQQVVCAECGNEFDPKKNLRYLRYYHMLNKNSHFFQKTQRRTERKRFQIVGKAMGDQAFMKKRIKIFLSYSHEDEEYKRELDTHLAPLKRSKKVETWNDRKLQPGAKLDEDIRRHLENDDIFILLISAYFLNSDYCYETEMSYAFDRASRGECKVIPVIVRPCLWKETPIKEFLALPQDGKAITSFENQDEAYLQIAQAISETVNRMLE